MVQARYPHIEDETKTVRLILNELDGHTRLGDAADTLLMGELPSTVSKLQDRLEHKMLQLERTGKDDVRGMQPPRKRSGHNISAPDSAFETKLVELFDTLDDRMVKSVSRIVSNIGINNNNDQQNQHLQGHQGNQKRNTRGLANRGHAINRKNDGDDQYDKSANEDDHEQEGKFLLHSAAHPSLLSFISANAKPLRNPTPILTANGTIHASHSADLRPVTAAGTKS